MKRRNPLAQTSLPKKRGEEGGVEIECVFVCVRVYVCVFVGVCVCVAGLQNKQRPFQQLVALEENQPVLRQPCSLFIREQQRDGPRCVPPGALWALPTDALFDLRSALLLCLSVGS